MAYNNKYAVTLPREVVGKELIQRLEEASGKADLKYRVIFRDSESYSVSPRNGSVKIVPHETRVSLQGRGLSSYADIDPRKPYTEFTLQVDGKLPKAEGNIKNLVAALYTVFEPQPSSPLV